MPRFDDHFIEAHRGASGSFPENTMLAFAEAAKAGTRSIETDLSLLADDNFAIFHDATLGRTVSGDAEIGSLDTAALAGLDAGIWRDAAFARQPVPTIDEALAWQAQTGIGFNWEMKCHHDDYPRHARALKAALRRADPRNTLVSSFDAECLAAIRAVMPDIALALIAETLPDDWREQAARLSLDGVHLDHSTMTAADARAVKSAGLALRCYTVNDAADIERIKALGVDMAMTDWPDRFAAQYG